MVSGAAAGLEACESGEDGSERGLEGYAGTAKVDVARITCTWQRRLCVCVCVPQDRACAGQTADEHGNGGLRQLQLLPHP